MTREKMWYVVLTIGTVGMVSGLILHSRTLQFIGGVFTGLFLIDVVIVVPSLVIWKLWKPGGSK
jgi:hypothetical protein